MVSALLPRSSCRRSIIMPENMPYQGENRKMFAKRMAGNKGMAGAANRFLQTDKKQKNKPITSQY